MRPTLQYWLRMLAGGIFGFYQAHLLYLLNPQIEISIARLAGITLLYALLGALLFGHALWLLHLLRRRISGRPDDAPEGLGIVMMSAFAAAGVFWFHLYAFDVYLPRAAGRALSSSTIIVGSTAFLLFLVWLLQRSSRNTSIKAAGALVLGVIVISSLFLFPRRERYRSPEREPAIADVRKIAGQRPVILVVIEDLPLDWLITAGAEGSVPQLEKIRTESFSMRVEPFPTTGLPPLWASLATGQLPHRHGVTGRYAYDTATSDAAQPYLILPSGVGFRAWGLIPPINRISARLPAGDSLPLWECFRRAGLEASVHGWPGVASPTRPPGAMRLPKLLESGIRSAPVNAGVAISIAAQADAANSLAAEQSLRGSGANLTAIWLSSLARSQRVLGVHHNRLPDRGSATGGTMRTVLTFVDGLVRQVIEARPDAIVVITSASGMRPPPLPGNHIPVFQYLDAFRDPGGDDGFVIFSGAPFVARQERASAGVVDIAPTVLFTTGLPVARDMDGRVLTEAFHEEALRGRSLTFIGTYERPDEDSGAHRPLQ